MIYSQPRHNGRTRDAWILKQRTSGRQRAENSKPVPAIANERYLSSFDGHNNLIGAHHVQL